MKTDRPWNTLTVIDENDVRIKQSLDILRRARKKIDKLFPADEASLTMDLKWKTEIDKELAKLEKCDSDYCKNTQYE